MVGFKVWTTNFSFSSWIFFFFSNFEVEIPFPTTQARSLRVRFCCAIYLQRHRKMQTELKALPSKLYQPRGFYSPQRDSIIILGSHQNRNCLEYHIPSNSYDESLPSHPCKDLATHTKTHRICTLDRFKTRILSVVDSKSISYEYNSKKTKWTKNKGDLLSDVMKGYGTPNYHLLLSLERGFSLEVYELLLFGYMREVYSIGIICATRCPLFSTYGCVGHRSPGNEFTVGHRKGISDVYKCI